VEAILSTYLLVRHAAHALLDQVLVGRMDGAALSDVGRQQALEVSERLRHFHITCVQSSPRQRTLETATVIARHRGLGVEAYSALDEIDFGRWSGRTFRELEHDTEWQRWNRARADARPPLGETMGEVQARVISHLERMHAKQQRSCVVLVTHAEVIRCALLHALALPVAQWWLLEIPPASVTRLELRSPTHYIVELSGGKVAA
jgi:broad specificity phosphatase PhoE